MGHPLDSLWAKKSRDGDMRWLPLTMHLKDCAAIAGYIWENWVSDGVKKNIADHCGGACEDAAKKLYVFTAAVHDVGKTIPVFQAQSGYGNSHDLNERLMENLQGAGLPMKPYTKFINPHMAPHALASQLLLERAGLPPAIAVIPGSHHGKTPGGSINVDINAQPENFHLERKGAAAWTSVQEQVVEYGMRIAEVSSFDELPLPDMEAQMLLTGLLVVADWIASNEKYFPLIDLDEPILQAREQVRAKKAFEKTEFLQTRWSPGSAWMQDDFFKMRFDFEENTVQKAVIDAASNAQAPGIMILEAPMGVGKTEAALAAAEILAYNTGRDGVYFALPTQATSDGIFPRMLRWIENLGDAGHSIELIHGKAQFNDTFLSLRRLEGSGEGVWEEDECGCASVAEWFSGRKKSILADFAVGTIDQLLQAALVQKHLMLRHVGLANKVVIVDECHAFDAYMNKYLERALTWMGAYGVPVIMLSATLPAAKRDALLNAYLNRKNKNLTQSRVTGYPLLSYTDGQTIKQEVIQNKAESTSVHINSIEEDTLSAKLETLLADGGCAGIIVNTVKRAQQTAKILRERFGDDVSLIHSRLVATDRLQREKELLHELGKPSLETERPHRRIVVGTQVLEQSLDIDFDVLFTDLCPMDLLLQRTGRLHRHRRLRPDSLAKARCYVMGMKEESFEQGTSEIYGDYILMRTKAVLPEVISIPDDISPLVQRVYGDDESIFAEKPKNYEEEKGKWNKKVERKENKAISYLLARPDSDESIENMLCATLEGSLAEAKVRDTDESLEINVIRLADQKLTLFSDPAIILSKDTPTPAIAKRIARDSLRLPAGMCREKTINGIIGEIEDIDSELLPKWQDSPWLKGSLILPLDENGHAVICGYELNYDSFLGLQQKKEGEEHEGSRV
ncbi:MAG: CRISPR-associated helicase Cas3' [Christensenella sp.]|nr:CRISPR-associated helicase Cas3' [Christensenella sp.]